MACLLERDGRYLVGRRPAGKRHGGLWEFPGGKTEPSESLRDAATRELAEELSLEVVDIGAPLLARVDPASGLEIVFLPVAARGEPEAHEHEALAWATPTELLDLDLAPTDRECARHLATG